MMIGRTAVPLRYLLSIGSFYRMLYCNSLSWLSLVAHGLIISEPNTDHVREGRMLAIL